MDTPGFSHPFLRGFAFDKSLIAFRDEYFELLDEEVHKYETSSPNDIRQALVNRNEIMSSYAISQAEMSSSVTPKMASEIRARYEADPNLQFPVATGNIKDIENDFDRQEFLNILRTFRRFSAQGIKVSDLSFELLIEIHRMLSRGLDEYRKQFFNVLPETVAIEKSNEGKFHWYHPGVPRHNDKTHVGSFWPVEHGEIERAVEDAIAFYKASPSLQNLNIFTAALYAIHPFSNGNKRVCRILEHALIRDLGLNKGNIYGHSYYYYREIKRFYENLNRCLETRNLNPMVNFSREGLFYSMIFVYDEGIKDKRRRYLERAKRQFVKESWILDLFVRNKEMGFGRLLDRTKRKISRRTLINYLNSFIDAQYLTKRKSARETYYQLALDLREEEAIKGLLSESEKELQYIPQWLIDSVCRIDEVIAVPQIGEWLIE